MKKSAKAVISLLMSVALLSVFLSYRNAEAYTPPTTTVKIGLYYGGSALPSANLQNVTGFGSGYQFGLLDDKRQFIPLGISTAETKLTVLRDRNMVYDSANNDYDPGLTGTVVVGCFHIQMNTAYTTYSDARAAAAANPLGFVKYSGGTYYVCIGSFVSADNANAAITAGKLTNCTVTSGSSSTVTVVKTGTNTILLEFENAPTGGGLAVMPTASGGDKCQTWFKGYRYYGSFLYQRLSGGDLTVINVVNLEDYVKGVIPYEMSSSWPLEALKAQSVCARTYVIKNLNAHTNFDVCTTIEDQVYRGVGSSNAYSDSAVDQTAGKFLTYNGALCTAVYASSDGGASENCENVWIEPLPYLRAVIDPYEADVAAIVPGYKWTVTYTPEELTARLRSKGYSCGTIVSMAITQYTEIGNVYKVTLKDNTGKTLTFTKGDTIRYALGVDSIRFTINGSPGSSDIYVNDGITKLSGSLASNFAVGQSGIAELLGQNTVYAITGTGETVAVGQNAQQSASGSFTMTGTGSGHNLGMSQWGAYSMAKYHSMTYDQILKFYFTGVTIG